MESLPNELNVHTCLLFSNLLKSDGDAVQGQSGGFGEGAHIPALVAPPILSAEPRRKPVPIPSLIFLICKIKDLNFISNKVQSQKLNSVSETKFFFPANGNNVHLPEAHVG